MKKLEISLKLSNFAPVFEQCTHYEKIQEL